MAKVELKFLDLSYPRTINIKVEEFNGDVFIVLQNGEIKNHIQFDKSTAIKFAKTLRTEINKIKDL